MTRRYILHAPPVSHMNGKLAPATTIVHNQPDSSESEVAFYYGYRYRHDETSRYAIREKARDLSVHPYRPDEQANKSQFAECVATAKTLLEDAATHAKVLHSFRLQTRYYRIWQYTIATLLANDGSIPPDWQ